ncbi:MAG: ATP-dependent DNA helicase RecG [Actinomycetaceae bacterium]|nr:ATP-dependent DNA helicase RecG [Actinomycetaceae bacterium]
MNPFDTPLDLRLPAHTAKKLVAAGYATVGDLLALAPRRYDHWGKLTSLRRLTEGEDVTILAQVVSQRLIANRNRAGVRLEVILTDGMDTISATFFAQNQWKLGVHQKLLRVGEQFLFAGKVGNYRGKLQLTHPQFEGAEGESEDVIRIAQRPIPIYPAGSGLTSWVISRAIGMLLDSLDGVDIPEVLPDELREEHDLPPANKVLWMLHRPEKDSDYKSAQKALAWQEALVLQTALVAARNSVAAEIAPACDAEPNRVFEAFMEGLPFELTDAQKEAIDIISRDMAGTRPMQRLLQADVGAGKTIVALAALLRAIGSGYQGALLAPTEVLAHQHAQSIRALCAGMAAREDSVGPALVDHPDLSVDIRVLTSSTPAAARKEILHLAATGAPLLLVGTHALIQDTVDLPNLAVAVVDEQHRFGVAQRDQLRRQKSEHIAHQLVMTATPIPRTVAMTVFGDLDETRMLGMPPGRTPVTTHLVDASNAQWMKRLWERAREEIDAGGRVYVVCPRISADEEESWPDLDPAEMLAAGVGTGMDSADTLAASRSRTGRRGRGQSGPPPAQPPGPPLASVEAVAAMLRNENALEGLGIHELTGQNAPGEKAQIMEDFSSGRAPLLVATTVIEVGVDVPEATMMVILDAQQFGLSQLHQLRGRVGRSSRPSLCMAVHRPALGAQSQGRLEAFASTTDGFALAQADLNLRREGDVLGADQSGRGSGLHYLSVSRDEDIVIAARQAAIDILDRDPQLVEHPGLAAAVRNRAGTDVVWMERG